MPAAPLFPSPDATPLGYFQVLATPLESAITLAVACGGTIPRGAQYALIQVETDGVRWRDDGVAPTATVGMLLLAADGPSGFVKSQFSSLSFIAASDGAILNIAVYGS
jgi:hypothetical protein